MKCMTECMVNEYLPCPSRTTEEECSARAREYCRQHCIIRGSLFRIKLGDHSGSHVRFLFVAVVKLFSDEGIPSAEVSIKNGLWYGSEFCE